jgi:hypothetical protein
MGQYFSIVLMECISSTLPQNSLTQSKGAVFAVLKIACFTDLSIRILQDSYCTGVEPAA